MSVPFSEVPCFYNATVDIKEKYSTVRLGTGDKNKDGTYSNSNWIPRFVGKAHSKLNTLNPKDRIKVTGKFTCVPYVKDGKKVFPPGPQMVVFDFEPFVSTKKAENTGNTNYQHADEDYENPDSGLDY